ncbi:putative efflux protein, MATE family [Clostridium cavendishii DSM 21758]|uniref:Multidrug export protein MepA n=1 Tax=Clostridium cavendishii DSM 21758 TaxID=1121302 RepID=A0A1M6GEU0_9CLOT|nr:MATE family efflux transporter [Clostridium cavendishii]SHJ08480.1 putative efflux protein, MATE family [Clostridium cavendishii DSM 21758]
MSKIKALKEYLFGKVELSDENVNRLLINLSIPTILAIVVNNLYQIINSIFVGKVIGEVAIGAVAIVSPFIGIILTFIMMVSTGGMSILSRSLGEGNKEKAKMCFGNSITLTVSIAILLTIVGYIFLDSIIRILGASGDIYLLSKDYLVIFMFGIIFMAPSFMFGQLLRAEGKARESMIILIIGSVTNILSDFIFIVFLRWGVKGAALSTTLANILSFSYGLIMILKRSSVLEAKLKYFNINFLVIKEIISIGLSSFISQGAGNIAILIANRVMINIGGAKLITAIGLFGMIQNLVFMPVAGVTQGMQPILGYNYGRERLDKVREVVRLTLKYVFFIALFNSAIVCIFTRQVAGLFVKSDTSVLGYAVPNIRIAIMFAAFGAQQWVGGTVFRAVGMAKKAYFFSVLRMILIFTPSIMILGYTLGPIGCWLSYALADLASGLISKRYLLNFIDKLEIKNAKSEDEDGQMKEVYIR